MRISVLSVFPEIYEPFLQTSLMRRASDNGIVQYDVDAFRAFCAPKERIDAPTFGHGAGMLIRPEVVQRAIEAKEQLHGKAFKIFFSPQGKKLDQRDLQKFATIAQQMGHIMLLPARYEGMDARVEEEYADALVSVGDFVLMGGDVPAMILMEGLLRYIPGVVGKQESVQEESFSGPFVDYPEYTEPVVWKGHEVPEVIRSGNHAQLRSWRTENAAQRTVRGHFDWLRSVPLTEDQKKLTIKYMPHHYVVLMHSDVIIGGAESAPGTTSVTSIDIHDIARSSKTYGIKQFFIVTPLVDQQKIVQKLLDFWLDPVGIEYNSNRHEALRQTVLCSSLQEVRAAIAKQEGVEPLVVATSARSIENVPTIAFDQQSRVWQEDRPVLFIFGTGKGLTPEVLSGADFLLMPVQGFSDFNHLSVRSAVAIILDRWLGRNITRLEQ